MELFGYVFLPEPIILGMAGAIFLLLTFDIIQFVKISNLKKRLITFTEGKDVKSMEAEIRERFSQIKELRERQAKSEMDIRNIFDNLKKTYQKSAIIKYNAFREMGGNLSFVMVFLDKENNGYLLNSVHSATNGSYMYAKEIVDGKSDVELSPEEEEAFNKAMEKKG